MKVCNQCHQLNPDDSVYCNVCGSDDLVTQTVVCGQCGTINDSVSEFCTECGAPLKSHMAPAVVPFTEILFDTPRQGPATYNTEELCPVCNHPLTMGEVFCSHCGHSFESLKRNRSVLRKVCPKCHTTNALSDAYCSYCFAPLEGADVEEFALDFIEAARQKDEVIRQAVLISDTNKKYKLCPGCNALNELKDDYCIKCGRKLTVKFRKKYCFVCGTANSYDAQFCTRCQYSFSGKSLAQAEGSWKCDCGHLNERDNDYCANCGKRHR